MKVAPPLEEGSTWVRVIYSGAKVWQCGSSMQLKTWSDAARAVEWFEANGKGHVIRSMITQISGAGYRARVWVI